MLKMNKKAEHEMKNFLIGFILFSLFGMLILVAVNSAGGSYGKDLTDVGGSGALSLSKFNDSISGIEQNSKDLNERFESGSVWSAVAGVVVEGVFGIAKTMVTMILTPFGILTNIMIDVLGVPVWVTSVILGILILSLIFSVWSLIKIGN